ncbi:hypothetical protein ONZ45_g9138 [Pleurotus djamor]|nr:hypothetical protein ONZ45_g9138 [Pleurotus djamor]
MIAVADNAMNYINDAGIPGTYLVDHVPILRYVPSWFPGAQFQQFAQAAYTAAQDMINVPYAHVREKLIKGEAPPCVVSRAYTRDESYLEEPAMESILKDVASVAYAGGVDTTNPPLLAFAAAMVLFPRVQEKAHLELDGVLEGCRLPSFEDQSSLPYSQAIMWELFRWKPVLPLGIAHRTTTDDLYSGYFLPGGSLVLANVWAIMRDENLFPQPDEFRPERFLNEDGTINRKLTEVVEITFGLGRRRIKSLECDIMPRSKEAVKLIRDSELELDLDALEG